MNARPSLAELEQAHDFQTRHIGPNAAERTQMLTTLGVTSLEQLMQQVIPEAIRQAQPLALPTGLRESQALAQLEAIAGENRVLRSLIGQGYYNCHTPNVILRNVLENPAWYTAYTPYQPEISQGRLEALLNFQTMISDLTGMEIANASLLDEATAAAEAMTLCQRVSKLKSKQFFVAQDVLPQTLDVIRTRAEPLGIEVVVGNPWQALATAEPFAVLLQYPAVDGSVHDYRELVQQLHARKVLVAVAADLLALTLLSPPGEWGADVVIGSSQRFGVPVGFGGPHAAFMATRDGFKRSMPGRLVGVSVDAQGQPAYRLALATREQHIRREKATSNICTAQVLLAVMASLYACWHGPQGLRTIAQRVHRLTAIFAEGLERLGLRVETEQFFDTLVIHTGARTAAIHAMARSFGYNLREIDEQRLGISVDETVTRDELPLLWVMFGAQANQFEIAELDAQISERLPSVLLRQGEFLRHAVFQRYHSETEMLRYLRRLADRDIALDRSMIPLGSCTMKLNATAEMLPITWPEFAHLHPFAPTNQSQGYQRLITELAQWLAEVTGYDAVSFQPNSGAQGEYAGLLAIRAYHRSLGQTQRDICLIPSSAHGTNPASAHMVGMQVVVTACDSAGNVDLADLQAKAEHYSERLAAVMITYPSTHGVFEEQVRDICALIHAHGGQVYLDGANLNAQVGLCAPGQYGADVSHLNLHKTFCIPHGGGGPGVGPVAVKAHLAPFLPGHRYLPQGLGAVGPVSAAPYGSASILPISWMYIALMGADGLRSATEHAILNANYIATRLAPYYPVLYSGAQGRVAHECILDLRPLKDSTGISNEDVAKRLMDYGFHAPTMSFPVPGTLMIEPTESESLVELERFIEAMIAIRGEIAAIESGAADKEDNPLKHAPHTALVLTGDWNHAYSREQAVFPVAGLRTNKYWPPVGRVDNAYGDRNVVCSCPALDTYR